MTSKKKESVEKIERLRVMGELSARVAHDLRNPLGVIKNAIELIEIDSKNNFDEKMKKRITMIKNASDRMIRQVNDVLDFVRTKPLELENNSISEILNSSLKVTIPKNIKISKSNNDANLLCDSRQLEVVFSNLITNAVQAIENNGELNLRINEGPKEVIVEIEDSGSGIPQENISKIFEPLFTTKPTGTGLGLVSCKNIVEQHGGTISVSNNPTVFTVKLPKNSRIKQE
ncbi:MAG: putative Histidine kinase [Nitrosopumilales archaeon]|nr:MAG: putative Histidine kinase [Nitrosopumilales archaeon]